MDDHHFSYITKLEKKDGIPSCFMNPKFRSPVKGANDSVLQRGFKQVLIPHIIKKRSVLTYLQLHDDKMTMHFA
jgi:hypothetical protein